MSEAVADFPGRARIKGYRMSLLFNAIICAVLMCIDLAASMSVL